MAKTTLTLIMCSVKKKSIIHSIIKKKIIKRTEENIIQSVDSQIIKSLIRSYLHNKFVNPLKSVLLK